VCENGIYTRKIWASLVAQSVKNLPAVQETQVRSLGWEDPLEEGVANPLQYSCLENLMDRGNWRVPVHRVTELDMTKATEHTHMH
jgi:hypothetical protein